MVFTSPCVYFFAVASRKVGLEIHRGIQWITPTPLRADKYQELQLLAFSADYTVNELPCVIESRG